MKIPHEHPLWPDFQDWAKANLSPEMMLSVWWACFLEGVRSGKKLYTGEGTHQHPDKIIIEKDDYPGNWSDYL